MEQSNTNKSDDYRDDASALIKKNLEVSEEILKIAKKLKHHMMWATVFGIIKILLFAVPIIIGILYLPPIIEGLMQQYKEILGLGGAVGGLKTIDTSGIDLNSLPPQIRNLIK